jgi:hypothetical protein
MTTGCDHSTRARRAGLGIALGFAVLAGCASGPGAVSVPLAPQRGPINTGTYPNLNVPPEVAGPAMTDEDKARIEGRVQSAQARQSRSGRGGGTVGDPAALQKLAGSHGPDTLKAISEQ